MTDLFDNFRYVPNGGTTLADALFGFIKEEIAFGRIKGGDKLPTIGEISEATGLTFAQARRVTESLAREGYVHSRPARRREGRCAFQYRPRAGVQKSVTRFESDPVEAGEKVADFAIAMLAKGRVPRPPKISPRYVFGETFPF